MRIKQKYIAILYFSAALVYPLSGLRYQVCTAQCLLWLPVSLLIWPASAVHSLSFRHIALYQTASMSASHIGLSDRLLALSVGSTVGCRLLLICCHKRFCFFQFFYSDISFLNCNVDTVKNNACSITISWILINCSFDLCTQRAYYFLPSLFWFLWCLPFTLFRVIAFYFCSSLQRFFNDIIYPSIYICLALVLCHTG